MTTERPINENERRWQEVVASGTLRKYIVDFEGDPEYPYLDSKGIITTGIGFNVNSQAAFEALDWEILTPDGKSRPATPEEVAEGYRLMQQERTRREGNFATRAEDYETATRLRLPDATIAQRFDKEIAKRTAQIVRLGGQETWDKMSPEARMALIDTAWPNNVSTWKGLGKALRSGDLQKAATETTFYTDSESGQRQIERLRRNFAAVYGGDPSEPKIKAAFEETIERNDQTRQKARRSIEGDEADTDLQGASSEKHLTDDPEVSRLTAFLSAEGDPEDEAMLKDDLTEDEVKTVMNSAAYNDEKDPRFEAVSKRVAWWFEDRFGNEKARKDAAGRLIQFANPKHPAPTRPLSSSVAKTGVPLTNEIAKVVQSIFGGPAETVGKGTPSRTLPLQGGGLGGGLPAKSEPRLHGHKDVGTVSPHITKLQETLNSDDLRHGGSIVDAPLKIDGIAGPKTRRALRRTVARFGADGILSKWS